MAKRGIKCKLYVNTGTYASPTWTAVATVSDAVSNAQWGEADASARDTPVKQFDISQMDLSVSGKARVPDAVDTAFDALAAAFLDGSAKDILVLNGASTENGATGYRYHAKVFNWSEDQAMGNVVYKDFLLKPTPSSEGLPKSCTVTSGAPVFTAIA